MDAQYRFKAGNPNLSLSSTMATQAGDIRQFHTCLKPTVFVTLLVLLGQLVFCTGSAYAFARLKFPGRDLIFVIFLGSLMIPEIVTMIPNYIIMKTLGWLDSFKAVILPQFFGNAFGVFLMRQFFTTIPKELEDAARIDGASVLRTLWTIIVPISMPALGTLTVLTFLKAWNNFLWPLIVINSENKYLLSVALSNLQGQYYSDWSGIMAISFLALLPMLLIFTFAQRYFITSIQMSGIK
jgi:ABC-type glycerol-3-phosphate transport system permease component